MSDFLKEAAEKTARELAHNANGVPTTPNTQRQVGADRLGIGDRDDAMMGAIVGVKTVEKPWWER